MGIYYRRSDRRLENKANFAESSYRELLVYPREILSLSLRLRRTKKRLARLVLSLKTVWRFLPAPIQICLGLFLVVLDCSCSFRVVLDRSDLFRLVLAGCGLLLLLQTTPTLQINDFKSDFISPLLLKLQKESSKNNFLFGDFNIDLLKYELSDSINNFINTLSSNFLLPDIYSYLQESLKPTSTLIDNIFSNSTSLEEIESDNVTSTFSDHLPQSIF